MISKAKLNELYKQQKACVRTICHAKNNIPTNPLCKKLKILKLPDLIELEMCRLGFQLETKVLPLPVQRLFDIKGGKKDHRYPSQSKNLPNVQAHSGVRFNQSFMCCSIMSYMRLSLEVQ